ncbi:hypothetical protein L2D08_23470 [Domibacillus sp. PGB-M46]|uniref:hypothetical protein n=1 Tax=Domibacillus sp. PGB-M46 TaxID=2910255 RepID=UPI001F59FAB6|nr:hypothetical protein [Domibacillus sp. PGB-M46]MCI2257274.1 hypothetical protein [Domibacillus sp. PGB-M46]
MNDRMYYLAKDSFDYYVYGDTDDVMIFTGTNTDIKWDLRFYLEKRCVRSCEKYL